MFFSRTPQLSKEKDENLKAGDGEQGRDCKTEISKEGVVDLDLEEVFSLGVQATPPGGFIVILPFKQTKEYPTNNTCLNKFK